MIKKQIGWQMEKFEFTGSLEGRQVYEQLRREIQSMQTNGWEVQSAHVLGYEATNGNSMVLLNLVKYEYVDESYFGADVPQEVTAKVGRPKKDA